MDRTAGRMPEEETTMEVRKGMHTGRSVRSRLSGPAGAWRRAATGALALATALVAQGLVPDVRAHTAPARPPRDAAVLSEIAEDVLRRALLGPESLAPEAIGPDTDPVENLEGVEDEPDPPFAHIAPAREGIAVPFAAGVAAPGDVKPPRAAGYRSATGRQRRGTTPSLSFSSGALAPPPGLDPALQAEAATVGARGRAFVYGFLLLRGRPDEALDRALADLGAALLGPHDDAYKARMPVASLAAIAALPEVAWVGVSPPDLKLSRELTAVRGPEGQAAGIGPATPLPIIISLFEGDKGGSFRVELEAAGATLGAYDPELQSYRAVASGPDLDRIAALDFVLFVELIEVASPGHDQSTPLIDADIIRPGTPMGHTRFGAATVTVGVLDTGFAIGKHMDLNKYGCGVDFTNDPGGAFDDFDGHGTHVLGTIAGTGTAIPRYRGVATAVGSLDYIRVAKVWNLAGDAPESWMLDAMDFMAQFTPCGGSVPPEVVNISGGIHGTAQTGTDSLSRKLDEKVWTGGQAYVVCSGNEGPLSRSIRRPGVAKNALTVGMVYDWGYKQVGDLSDYSSQGPTGDGRMKPNVVAPGTDVISAKAGTTNQYIEKGGCSMATPHVTGLAATLMDHYPVFRGRPALLRAHLMATAIAHEDFVSRSNLYGLGRVSGYVSHWDHPNSAGWSTYKFWGGVNSQGFQYNDIVVPSGTKRLIVVLTWDEPAASAGASRAVTYDLDLWVDRNADCGFVGNCGEYGSGTFADNVEFVVVDNPPAGTYRLKAHPWNAPSFNLPYGMVATVIRGDTTPAMFATLTAPPNPTLLSSFDLTLNVATPSYVASGVYVELVEQPDGLLFHGFRTIRHDGTYIGSSDPDGQVTLGNLVPLLGRSATWSYRADTPGPKTFKVKVWSENGGEIIASTTIEVMGPAPNLTEFGVTLDPPLPVLAPGASFAVTDTVENSGSAPAGTSTTRYWLSTDTAKNAGDVLLSGQRSVPALIDGANHTGTAAVTIPGSTAMGTYYVLACADDRRAVKEDNENDNCRQASAAITVTRPDLVSTPVSAPPATVRRGGKFSVTDTTRNIGAVPSGSSKTRYHLSLDVVKGAGDIALSGARSVPGLAAGAAHTGSVTVGVPSGTAPATYFVLACADGTTAVVEALETNNCLPADGTVTITP
jgi:hypothetical protein